jgi:hypothetical protein
VEIEGVVVSPNTINEDNICAFSDNFGECLVLGSCWLLAADTHTAMLDLSLCLPRRHVQLQRTGKACQQRPLPLPILALTWAVSKHQCNIEL